MRAILSKGPETHLKGTKSPKIFSRNHEGSVQDLTKPTLGFQNCGPGVLDFLANYDFKPPNDCFFDTLTSNYASHHIFKRTHQTTWKRGYSIIAFNSVYKSTEA